jgi:hypothetical protein
MLRTVNARISIDDRAEVLAEAFETHLKRAATEDRRKQ